MDTIKGLALIATFIGVFTIFAMWVSLWDNVWRVSVQPVRGAIYDTRLNRLGPSPCLMLVVRTTSLKLSDCLRDVLLPSKLNSSISNVSSPRSELTEVSRRSQT